MQKKAFTLIELIISISILSLMMLYLYQSYASLNQSNTILKKEVSEVLNTQELRKVLFLDFSLAKANSIQIENLSKREDFVSLQTSNSLHQRFNPYVAYIVKENKLYRLESLNSFTGYDLTQEQLFDVDSIGEVNNFRIYKSTNLQHSTYLIDITFQRMDNILLKVEPFVYK